MGAGRVETMTATEQLRPVAESRPAVILCSLALLRRFDRQMYDNLRYYDGPFTYAHVNPDGTTFPRLTYNGIELRVRKGLRKPIAGKP